VCRARADLPDVVTEPGGHVGERLQLIATISFVAKQWPEADVERVGLTCARDRRELQGIRQRQDVPGE
jgi:hypothetical protein